MKTINFTLNAKTVESYLYGGYVFLLMADGRILYVSYYRLIYALCEHYEQYDKLIKLAFLHNEYLNSDAAKLLLGIGEIHDAVTDLWNKAADEIKFEIDFEEIEQYCKCMGKWNNLPLDVYMYDLRMYIASTAGVMEARLNPDFNNHYSLHPSKFQKCFDSKVIALNAKAGKVVLSADRDGLFYGNALVEDKPITIEDKNNIPVRSLRTGWSDFDLINYESQSDFLYLSNETEDIKQKSTERFRFGEKRERKEIVKFATSQYDLVSMIGKTKIKKDDIAYAFNSQGRSFFLLKNGSFVNVGIRKSDEDTVEYSSTTRELPTPKGQKSVMKPIKSAIVPKGCVIELFDKVLLYKNGEVLTLADSPVYNIRTYMGSRNYKDMLTITTENAVAFHSVDILDSIKSKRVLNTTYHH